ncbi:MAG: electron transfer flavoprotein subunit alpha/FixB family protein [Spirochaetia bacterium]|nr:electron transfer flavoprotein subunit alpha/FixB family protein [Spirochaetia bacterium]
MKKSLIYIETEYVQDGIDLLETAREIYQDEPYETYALIINSEHTPLINKFDVVLSYSDEQITYFDQIAVSDIISHLHKTYSFDTILIPATHYSRILAPRVAMLLNTGLVADVTKIAHGAKGLELIRPAYSGRIMACIQITGSGPIMLTVRPGIFRYKGQKRLETQVITLHNLTYRRTGMRVIERKEKSIEYDIRESKVLISGGGGVEKYFDTLLPLATLLDAQVSASRAIVDKGLLSRNFQVGQSGKTVSPTLYIALGIYGALQHIEGLHNVDYIISVNTNKEAPICSLSNIVVEGDAYTFIQKMIEKIKKENDNECK